MKTTFKSSEIAHVWAHKSAPHGTSPGAMSFNGDAFLSYGTEIARHITFKGKAAVILNETSYSVTTSGHQSCVRQSLPSDVPVFKIGGVGRGDYLGSVTGKELFEYSVGEAAKCEQRASKARNRAGQHEADAARYMESVRQISAFFGLRRKVDLQTIHRLRESSARAEKKAAQVRAQREQKEREEMAEGYSTWLKGEEGPYFRPSLFPVAFRVEGDELVSTLGARVPLHAARVAFRFARTHKDWHRNGETCPVGNYQLDAINAQGIVAGCHRISWDEVERLAPILS